MRERVFIAHNLLCILEILPRSHLKADFRTRAGFAFTRFVDVKKTDYGTLLHKTSCVPLTVLNLPDLCPPEECFSRLKAETALTQQASSSI